MRCSGPNGLGGWRASSPLVPGLLALMEMADGTQLTEATRGVIHHPSIAVPDTRRLGRLESIPLPARCRLSPPGRQVSLARRGRKGCIFRFGR